MMSVRTFILLAIRENKMFISYVSMIEMKVFSTRKGPALDLDLILFGLICASSYDMYFVVS